MIPNIFVSSTVQDLHYLRDAIRDQIFEIGYNPIMSDYGEIGYLPSTTAENSCYLSMKECQIAVLVIGKKYSGLAKDGISVTHNEYQIAKESSIPVICLVDKDVLSYKKVYDYQKENGGSELSAFPEMDNPEMTFKLIDDFKKSKVNNGYLPFANAGDAMKHLKMQLAHIFGQLLRDRFDPIKGSIKDILSEIKTLKFELLKNDEKNYDSEPFLRSIRYLLDDRNRIMHSLVLFVYDSLEEGVVNTLKYNDFKQFYEASGFGLELVDARDLVREKNHGHSLKLAMSDESLVDEETNESIMVTFGISEDEKKIISNEVSVKVFTQIYEKLKLLQAGAHKIPSSNE